MHVSEIKSLIVFSLNVCGLVSKLRSSNLEEICQNYYILCFNETKLDEYDEMQITNFINLSPLNRKGAKCRSGGIIVFAKKYIFENVEALKSWSEIAYYS